MGSVSEHMLEEVYEEPLRYLQAKAEHDPEAFSNWELSFFKSIKGKTRGQLTHKQNQVVEALLCSIELENEIQRQMDKND